MLYKSTRTYDITTKTPYIYIYYGVYISCWMGHVSSRHSYEQKGSLVGLLSVIYFWSNLLDNPHLCRHMASPGHNHLLTHSKFAFWPVCRFSVLCTSLFGLVYVTFSPCGHVQKWTPTPHHHSHPTPAMDPKCFGWESIKEKRTKINKK